MSLLYQENILVMHIFSDPLTLYPFAFTEEVCLWINEPLYNNCQKSLCFIPLLLSNHLTLRNWGLLLHYWSRFSLQISDISSDISAHTHTLSLHICWQLKFPTVLPLWQCIISWHQTLNVHLCVDPKLRTQSLITNDIFHFLFFGHWIIQAEG